MPVESKGDTNPLLEAAQEIGQQVAEVRVSGDSKVSVQVQGKATVQQSAPEPNIGSYEAFMSSFGNPKRWAGR